MAKAENSNYFFVVDNQEYKGAEVFAAGQGLDTLESLARLAVLHESQHESEFTQRLSWASNMESLLNATTPGLDDSTTKGVNRGISVGADWLDDVIMTWNSQTYVPERIKHTEQVFNQVRDGVRSSASALSELRTDQHDFDTMGHVYKKWFDDSGRKILHPGGRPEEYAEKSDRILALVRTTRRSSKHFIVPEIKSALFEVVPKKANAYEVDTLPLMPRAERWRGKGPFYAGKMLTHRTFGYVEPRTDTFVPVVTQLSAEHPVQRRISEANAKKS
jgi:hypothetical protein